MACSPIQLINLRTGVDWVPPIMTLYTVEQLELIRRLKLTGISIDAVIEAFNEMNNVTSRLDTDSFARAASLMSPPSSLNTMGSVSMGAALTAPLPTPQSTIAPSPIDLIPSSVQTSLASVLSSSSLNQVFLALQAQNPVPVTISSSPSLQLHTVPVACTTSSNPELSPPHPSSSNSSEPRPRSQKTPMREITTLDDPLELEEFMKKGEEECIQDMKGFITHYSLRQTTVAMMTGVSQPYISKLLNGNHRELSLRCRKNIYSWYLNCRRHPEKLTHFLNDPSSRLETNGDGELVPQKRERYVFRPILLRLLEQFFSETPFPDVQKRIEIATACNHALQQEKKGLGLVPKEVVSPQVVSNWFANKRKELRRKTNDGSLRQENGAIVEALQRNRDDDRSDNGSISPEDDNQSISDLPPPPQMSFPPPDMRIFQALFNAQNGSIFQPVKSEPLEIKDQY